MGGFFWIFFLGFIGTIAWPLGFNQSLEKIMWPIEGSKHWEKKICINCVAKVKFKVISFQKEEVSLLIAP